MCVTRKLNNSTIQLFSNWNCPINPVLIAIHTSDKKWLKPHTDSSEMHENNYCEFTPVTTQETMTLVGGPPVIKVEIH